MGYPNPADADLRLTTLPISGFNSRAYKFTSGDFALFDNVSTYTDEFTISFWTDLLSLTGNQTAVGQTGSTNSGVLLEGGNDPDRVRVRTNAGTTEALLPEAGADPNWVTTIDWMHIIVSRDSSDNVRYYRGGKGVVPVQIEGEQACHANNMILGQLGRLNTANVFVSKLFDVRFYDSNVSAGDRAIINLFGTNTTATLDRWHQCQEGSGTALVDATGNDTDGAITAADIADFHYLGTDVPHSYVVAEDTEISSKAVQGLDILVPGTLIVEDIEGNQTTRVFTAFIAAGGEYNTFPYRLMGRFRTLKAGSTITPSNMIALH